MERPVSPRASSRDAILDAASAVVQEQGAAHLTLDAVSARAAVSKGGLLYHFPSKEALLLGMLARLSGMVAEAHAAEAARLPARPGRELRAHIRVVDTLRSPRMRRYAAALLAAGAHDPRLLEPIRRLRTDQIAACARGGLPVAFVAAVVLAVEGLWLAELVDVSLPSARERRAVVGCLNRLVDAEEDRLHGMARNPRGPAARRRACARPGQRQR